MKSEKVTEVVRSLDVAVSIDSVMASMGDFEPIAWFDREMDQLIYMEVDVSYTAERVDPFLTLLWDPDTREKLAGIKLKGIRHFFEDLKREGAITSDSRLINLITVFSRILVESLGPGMIGELESQYQAKRKEKYKKAHEMASRAGQVRFRLAA